MARYYICHSFGGAVVLPLETAGKEENKQQLKQEYEGNSFTFI